MRTSQLFTTPEEIDKAVSDFKNLSTSAGWLTFVRILDANIADVTDKILHKAPGATEADLDLLRNNLALMEEMKNTPQKMVEVLGAQEIEQTESVDLDNIYDSVPEKKEEAK